MWDEIAGAALDMFASGAGGPDATKGKRAGCWWVLFAILVVATIAAIIVAFTN